MKTADSNFEISKTIKGNLPRLPFMAMKEKVLGKNYNLSLVLIADNLSRRLNKTYRGKDYPANILSFPISKNEGEIFLNLRKARRQAPQFNQEYNNFLAFLFIHGLFHLKGYSHGSRMENEERSVRLKFGLK